MIKVLPITAIPMPCDGGIETPIFSNLTLKGYIPFASAVKDPIVFGLDLK